MEWVTRRGVKLDRCACAWLILRRIDPQATLLYEEAAAIPQAVAAGALPFHNTSTEDPDWGERTSFELLLAEYNLDQHDPALVALGDIVRGAELGEEPQAESAGLHAITKGARALARDDADMVARMLSVFDALYTYCAARSGGQPEWPAEGSDEHAGEELATDGR